MVYSKRVTFLRGVHAIAMGAAAAERDPSHTRATAVTAEFLRVLSRSRTSAAARGVDIGAVARFLDGGHRDCRSQSLHYGIASATFC